VTRVVGPDELVAVAVALASTIASKPRRGVEATKHMLRTSWHTDLAGSLGSSFWVTSALQNSRDLKEGIDASLEKRTPRYNTTVNRGDSD
jgi:enoyl-CoA hydratase